MIPLVSLLDVVLVAIDAPLSMPTSSLLEGKVRAKERTHDGPAKHGDRIGANQLAHKRHRAVFEHADNVLAHHVQILLAHLRHLVLDGAGVVHNNKRRLLLLRLLIELIVFVHAIEFLQERLVGCARKTKNRQPD